MFDSWHFLKAFNLKGKYKSEVNRAIFRTMMSEDQFDFESNMRTLTTTV